MMSVILGLLIPPGALLVILGMSWFEDHVLVPPRAVGAAIAGSAEDPDLAAGAAAEPAAEVDPPSGPTAPTPVRTPAHAPSRTPARTPAAGSRRHRPTPRWEPRPAYSRAAAGAAGRVLGTAGVHDPGPVGTYGPVRPAPP